MSPPPPVSFRDNDDEQPRPTVVDLPPLRKKAPPAAARVIPTDDEHDHERAAAAADEENDDENEDEQTVLVPSTNQGLRPVRRKARNGGPPPRGAGTATTDEASGMLSCIWILLLVLLVVMGLGLLVFRRQTMPHASTSRSGPTPSGAPIHYEQDLVTRPWHPLDWTVERGVAPLEVPWGSVAHDDATNLGFASQPAVWNDTLVFVSQGDLYWSRVRSGDDADANSNMPAMRLTTTVGNVRRPVRHPVHAHLLAFTATYQAYRDVYLLDLSKSRHVQRVTCFGVSFGVTDVVGWKDASTLYFTAPADRTGIADQRLYELTLQQEGDGVEESENDDDDDEDEDDDEGIPLGSLSQVLEIDAVPLSQATDGVYYEECLYFVRYKQSSHTYRYVGGTAESLWAYCDQEETAVALTSEYPGTSKSPQLWTDPDQTTWLFFLSDRSVRDEDDDDSDETWRATSMNLWAMPLPSKSDLYPSVSTVQPVQLTHVSCDFDGLALQEYSVDPVTGNVVLRIGADLYLLESQSMQQVLTGKKKKTTTPTPLPIQVLSDFETHQERLFPLDMAKHFTYGDVFETPSSTLVLLTARGQVLVAPVLDDQPSLPSSYAPGQNMPLRSYRVAPGTATAGAIRVLRAVHLPSSDDDGKHWALLLATDPASPTAEHAFYRIEVQPGAINVFGDAQHWPTPFLGGNTSSGGSTASGGLGSVKDRNFVVSPCGRRMAWTDLDGRICVMPVPTSTTTATADDYTVLPDTNELGQVLNGERTQLSWSPGGRYLTATHNANNQFSVISLVDCGDASVGAAAIRLGRLVQVTPSRFNSFAPYWGKTTVDDHVGAETGGDGGVATTLYFLSDRDIKTQVKSPWGDRQPMPYFPRKSHLYALPLMERSFAFAGGAAQEVVDPEALYQPPVFPDAEDDDDDDDDRRLRSGRLLLETTTTTTSPSVAPASTTPPRDLEIDFGPPDLSFARRAYHLAQIPAKEYVTLLSQTMDDGSFVLVVKEGEIKYLTIMSMDAFPSDSVEENPVLKPLSKWGISSTREHLYVTTSPDGSARVIPNTIAGLTSFYANAVGGEFNKYVVDTHGLFLTVWPGLEYKQMFGDAWRMFRDYFYDRDMHGVDWPAVFDRYEPLVGRCSKREELDDVLIQMASELSALHVFVYGGEYAAPFGGDAALIELRQPASLGATLKRTMEWKGYMVVEIPVRDADFDQYEERPFYSPVGDEALVPTGQKGLREGDVIVGINGESVLNVVDVGMLLRGMAGRSVRLEVLRLASGDAPSTAVTAVPEPLIVVPISTAEASTLYYASWEWRTRQKAKELASAANFTVGYVHLQGMGTNDEDAFARAFFPDYDKQGMILDLRHNHGGNIDSWIVSALQRVAWMFWGDRRGIRNGDFDWNQQYTFRGHLVVLVDEKTSSDGEGVTRGIMELGLGRVIGTRTWGGGIWLSSDNKMVDGGIATAPEIGVFNDHLDWGMGIENHGLVPDIEVDNNPRSAFDGKDDQLERAVSELAAWLEEEPVVEVRPPQEAKPDMSMPDENCPA